ncbi:MAG TPA: metal-dependent transcriptional regulator [Melioribacteraceae bacterium]|nr:metal-dependent transcriptional regulator [Melioribacteraceae bacterium]
MSPILILSIGAAFVLLLVFFFYPGKGLTDKWKRLKRQDEKMLLEDALKHLYDCEYKSVDCSPSSLSGNLSISISQSNRLIFRLAESGLISRVGDRILLSNEGRSYALRIIRIHRLWEKYLADNTSVKETDWHSLAELKEHELSVDETNLLAAKLGNPLKDPHGDPIPDESGEIPVITGISLPELQDGKFGRILHLEDEPKEIYSQLVAQGLYPGMLVRIVEKNRDRIKFESNGEESVLSPILALNVQVQPLKETDEIDQSFETLADVSEGEEAVVVGLSRALRGQQRRRMLDFGIVPGTLIRAQLKSLGGDPTAFEIRGTTIALRNNQSSKIFIRKV